MSLSTYRIKMADDKHDSTSPLLPLHNNTSVEWTPQAITAIVSVSLLTILTVFGNVLVIIAVAKYKRLQIPSNFILINLAVSDISVAAFAPLVLCTELIVYLFDSVYVCMLPYCLVTLGCGVSLLHLGVVAYDRYAALVKPLKYYQHITAKRILCFSLIIWLYVCIIAFTPFCWYYFVGSREEKHSKCTFYLLQNYVTLFQVVMVFVPAFVVMIGCYCRVLLVARHHSRAISAIQLSLFPNSFNKNFHMFKGNKYSWTLLIILGFFCLTWVTFILTLLVELFCTICMSLHQYSFFLIFANSCFNPWIYAHRNQDFKAAFRRLFRTLFCIKKKSQSSNRGDEGRRNSRVSDALSRTNSMAGGLQHLHVLYENADIIPATVAMETCQSGSKTCRAVPKLIQHDLKLAVETVLEDNSNVSSIF